MAELYNQAVESALEGTLVLFKLSSFFKKRQSVFTLIERSPSLTLETPDDESVVLHLGDAQRKVSASNVSIYTAFFHLTHPAFEPVSKAIEFAKSNTDKEKIIDGWENIFTEQSIKDAASTFQEAVRTILNTI